MFYSISCNFFKIRSFELVGYSSCWDNSKSLWILGVNILSFRPTFSEIFLTSLLVSLIYLDKSALLSLTFSQTYLISCFVYSEISLIVYLISEVSIYMNSLILWMKPLHSPLDSSIWSSLDPVKMKSSSHSLKLSCLRTQSTSMFISHFWE